MPSAYPAGSSLTHFVLLLVLLLEPDIGDVRPADVRRVNDRCRLGLQHVRARVHQQLLAEQRDQDGIFHDVLVRGVPVVAGGGEAGGALSAMDQSVQCRAAVAPVVGGVQHAVGLYFFFNDTATTEIYTLSLHDALPI